MGLKTVVVSGASALTSGGFDGADLRWGGANAIGMATEASAASPGFAEFPSEEQAPNRSDQRAMGKTMLAAVFTAGRALERAGLKGDEARLAATQLLTAGKCVERDDRVDAMVLDLVAADGWSQADVNRTLAQNLRPSLFLSQLPNLISANISIVHGVLGRSQTFFGEELAGLEVIATAYQRLAHGETERCLVGGVFSAEGRCVSDVLQDRAMTSGEDAYASGAAFLVLETEEAARERGHTPAARVILCDRADHAAEDKAGAEWIMQSLRSVAADQLAELLCFGPSDPRSTALHKQLADDLGATTPGLAVASLTGRAAMLEAAAPVGAAILSQSAQTRGDRANSSRLALVGLGRGFGQSVLVLERC